MPVYLAQQIAAPRGVRSARAPRPNREELLGLGLTPAQADHELIRRHELEVIEENFTRWVVLFGCIICTLLPVSFALFLYLMWSYAMERNKDCDEPLDTWFIVVLVNIMYHVNVNGRSLHKQVIRLVCRHDSASSPEATPCRVRGYLLAVAAFVFGWHCLGLHWVRISSTCASTAPNLYRSVRLFAAFNIVFTVFTTVSTFGLSQMLASLLRRGLLPAGMLDPHRGAPEGTMELQQSVEFDAEALGETSQCPTCLEDFSKEARIKRTVCGHLFHEECLGPWLRVSRTCPLCRTDLAAGLQVPLGATIPVTEVPPAVAELDLEAQEEVPAGEDVAQSDTSPRAAPQKPAVCVAAVSAPSSEASPGRRGLDPAAPLVLAAAATGRSAAAPRPRPNEVETL